MPDKGEKMLGKSGIEGFTLVELMIVIAIIAIIAAIAIPMYSKYQIKSRFSEADSNIDGIYKAESAFSGKYNVFFQASKQPRANAGLDNLRVKWPGKWKDCNTDPEMKESWCILGWAPEGSVYFNYMVSNDGANVSSTSNNCADGVDSEFLGNGSYNNAVNVVAGQDDICIEACADIDDDNNIACLHRGDEIIIEPAPVPSSSGQSVF